MDKKISSPQKTRNIIDKYEFSLKKKFGQNFLIDQNILNTIVEGAKVNKEDIVLEIGPGIGSLTQYLAEEAKEVIAVEIDKTLIPILEETLEEYDNVTIIQDDVLKIDLKKFFEDRYHGQKIKVVANLPYYITTPIIMKFFEEHIPVESITVMVQKEVADRMQAKPSTKDYGALSLAVQYYSVPEIIVQVPPSCFIPKPNVGSTVISLVTSDRYTKQEAKDQFLFELIKGAFQQRRKTLVNTLSHQSYIHSSKEEIKEALIKMGLSETVRGEALSLQEFITLSKLLS